jgi:hypothetical protein
MTWATTPAIRDGLLVATLLLVSWRFLPAGQAFVATLLCTTALWLTLHPVVAANLMTAVARLY